MDLRGHSWAPPPPRWTEEDAPLAASVAIPPTEMGHRAGVSVDAGRGGVPSEKEALAASFPAVGDLTGTSRSDPVQPGSRIRLQQGAHHA